MSIIDDAAVHRRLRLKLSVPGGHSVPLEADLVYSTADPFAVTIVFHTDAGLTEWVFARALLAQGLDEQAGTGDVQVWPGRPGGPATVWLSVTGEDGLTARFELLRADVEEFLAASYKVVGDGEEAGALDFDAAVAELFDSP